MTYADVRREHPRYQLPRGTLGWEPRARTVNGGPGWAQAPQSKPLTRVERLRGKVKRAEGYASKGWELFGEVAGGRVRRWSLVLSAVGLLLVWARAASRAFSSDVRAFSRTIPEAEVIQRPTSPAAHERTRLRHARARPHAGLGGCFGRSPSTGVRARRWRSTSSRTAC